MSAAPKALNKAATIAPPAKTLNMMRQEAMRVHKRMAAPIIMAMNEVSPIEPGINPVSISLNVEVIWCPAPACPSGVAAVKPSASLFPRPSTCSVLTQTASPLIFVGHAKKRNARATSAGLKMFIPVPPKISFAKITENATATASIQSGVPTGTTRGMSIPETR